MSAHITSFLILCRPENRQRVANAAVAFPGLEIHHCGEDGKIVALAEGGNEAHITQILQELQNVPGVIAANLVYHGIAEE